MRPRYHPPMGKMRRLAIALVLGAALGVPSSALGVILVPPGKSGASQYFEDIPTSAGNAAPPGTGPGSGTTSSPGDLAHLGQGHAGAAKLSRLGKDGQAAATLAQQTAPVPAAGAGSTKPGSAASPSVTPPQANGGSATGAVADALGGTGSGGGLGLVFPALLAAGVAAALGLGVWRIARHSGQSGLPG